MGYSQIYIYWKHTNPNGGIQEGFIARELINNCGEAMVSRATALLTYLSYMIAQPEVDLSHVRGELISLCDMNCDTKVPDLSSDLLTGVGPIFPMLVDDGRLLIDITDSGVRYGAECWGRGRDTAFLCTLEDYMSNQMGSNWKSTYGDHEFRRQALNYTSKNIDTVLALPNVTPMTRKEMHEFLTRGYSKFIVAPVYEDGRPKDDTKAKTPKEIISQNAELDYMKSFIKESFFDQELFRDQLRMLWTAFCLHHNIDVDTSLYDATLKKLWATMVQTGDSPSEWGDYEAFDLFMAQYLA